MITLILLTLLVILLLPVPPAWRQALVIACYVLIVLLWLAFVGALPPNGHWFS